MPRLALAAAAVIGGFDPDHDRKAELLSGLPALSVQHVLLEKNDSMAALSAQAPTRPIEPARPASRSSRTNLADRNWLPLSVLVCTAGCAAAEWVSGCRSQGTTTSSH